MSSEIIPMSSDTRLYTGMKYEPQFVSAIHLDIDFSCSKSHFDYDSNIVSAMNIIIDLSSLTSSFAYKPTFVSAISLNTIPLIDLNVLMSYNNIKK